MYQVTPLVKFLLLCQKENTWDKRLGSELFFSLSDFTLLELSAHARLSPSPYAWETKEEAKLPNSGLLGYWKRQRAGPGSLHPLLLRAPSTNSLIPTGSRLTKGSHRPIVSQAADQPTLQCLTAAALILTLQIEAEEPSLTTSLTL